MSDAAARSRYSLHFRLSAEARFDRKVGLNEHGVSRVE